MDEEKKQDAADSGAGDKPESLDKIERAERAVKRMEDAEKRIDEKISKLTELQADKILGSSAGIRTEPEKPKEQTDTEYAEALERGEVNPLKADGIFK